MFKVLAIILIISTIGNCQECRSLNQECGGIAQHKCCLGRQLICVYEQPLHPEAKGVCQKTCSKEGGLCGGYSLDPPGCCAGLKCVQRDVRLPDLPGNCTV